MLITLIMMIMTIKGRPFSFYTKINNICSILLQVDYVDHDDDDNQYWTILFLHKINNLYSTALHFPRLNNLLFSHRKELNVVIMVITLIYAGCYICYFAIKRLCHLN